MLTEIKLQNSVRESSVFGEQKNCTRSSPAESVNLHGTPAGSLAAEIVK